MKMVLWDVNASDYIPKSLKYKFITDPNLGKRPGIKDSLYIKNFILKKIKGGSIILVHNGALESMKSLGEIIEKAQFNGFQFVTLSELFK